MGSYARLMSAHGNALGFAAPQLYRDYLAQPERRDDGERAAADPGARRIPRHHHRRQRLYTALPGYDYTTGLGTLDMT